MNESKVFISIKDKETGEQTNEITIEDLIFNQAEIEFEYVRDNEVIWTLPYKDFLFFQNDYEVIVRIVGD